MDLRFYLQMPRMDVPKLLDMDEKHSEHDITSLTCPIPSYPSTRPHWKQLCTCPLAPCVHLTSDGSPKAASWWTMEQTSRSNFHHGSGLATTTTTAPKKNKWPVGQGRNMLKHGAFLKWGYPDSSSIWKGISWNFHSKPSSYWGHSHYNVEPRPRRLPCSSNSVLGCRFYKLESPKKSATLVKFEITFWGNSGGIPVCCATKLEQNHQNGFVFFFAKNEHAIHHQRLFHGMCQQDSKIRWFLRSLFQAPLLRAPRMAKPWLLSVGVS